MGVRDFLAWVQEVRMSGLRRVHRAGQGIKVFCGISEVEVFQCFLWTDVLKSLVFLAFVCQNVF